ncbi:TetR family transcriptional regulator [Hydrogenoanaerobacterium sp.]|uniref:TetR/AcrR family transcriptional regulator n=1 Tax=Hydrogenoanaerobacterium sp. TaxID=2953763 RepID=UPI00289FC9BD|nr:TetR family transcriptional regulator [Hydrogenoanaerobacterium sp.]
MKLEVKEKLLQAAAELMKIAERPEAITSRDIAAKAGVNLAMINYYFSSKDELMYLTAAEIIKEEADAWAQGKDTDSSPYQRLRQMLIELSDITIQFSRFTKISVEYELIKADIVLPQYILPLIREICGNKRSEFEMRLTAYEIMSFLQVLFLRSDAFFQYAGTDIHNRDHRIQMIDAILSSHFL